MTATWLRVDGDFGVESDGHRVVDFLAQPVEILDVQVHRIQREAPVCLGRQQRSATGRAWRRRDTCCPRNGWRCRPERRTDPRRPTSPRPRCPSGTVSVTANAPIGDSTSTTTSSGASALTCSALRFSAASRFVWECASEPRGRVADRRCRTGLTRTTVRAGSSWTSTSASRAAGRSAAAHTVFEIEDHDIGCGRGLFESLRTVGRAEQPCRPGILQAHQSRPAAASAGRIRTMVLRFAVATTSPC